MGFRGVFGSFSVSRNGVFGESEIRHFSGQFWVQIVDVFWSKIDAG